MLKKRIKRLLNRIFLSIVDIDYILNEYNTRQRKVNESKLILGSGSKLYPECQVFNRLSKSNIQIGKDTHIRGILKTMHYGGKIEIGNKCYIGHNCQIWSGERISIGNNVLISHNVNIIDTNSHELDYHEREKEFEIMMIQKKPKLKGSIITDSITIEDHAWINFNSVISKGVKIGKGAIIAPNSVVTKDVPSFTLVAGVPAKVIKKLD